VSAVTRTGSPRTGRTALVEQLLADGFTHMFGNPGTVEQGFLDELTDHPELSYVLALQETVAVGIADGYARATAGPGRTVSRSSRRNPPPLCRNVLVVTSWSRTSCVLHHAAKSPQCTRRSSSNGSTPGRAGRSRPRT